MNSLVLPPRYYKESAVDGAAGAQKPPLCCSKSYLLINVRAFSYRFNSFQAGSHPLLISIIVSLGARIYDSLCFFMLRISASGTMVQ